MEKSKKDGLSHLEIKIENMLDDLINSDEEVENSGLQTSLKLSDDNSSSEEDQNDKLFDKDFFSNINSQQQEQKQPTKNINYSNYNLEQTSFQNKNFQNNNQLDNTKCNNNNYNNFNNNNFNNINFIYNNYLSFPFNQLIISSINNNNNSNYPPLLRLSNNNMNINLYNTNINNIIINNQNNYENINTKFSSNFENNYPSMENKSIYDTSFSSNYNSFSDINNNNLRNNKRYNSLVNYGCQNCNNSFNNENKKLTFNRSKKYHNSYYAGDKICFNKNIINANNNYKNNNHSNTNVELEILFIEINKILNKIEKIDQICLNKIKGRFEQIILTHKGSRIFQNYLKNTHSDILHQILLEIKNKLPELLKDNYANYFCKKFFDNLNQKDRIEYLTTIKKDLNTLAIDPTATYPIQGIIEKLGSKAEKKIIYLGIKDSIAYFCYNIYGTHILVKILSYFEDEFIKEIIDYAYNNFIELSYHIHGICIVKKLLLMTHKKDLHKNLKKKIIDNALNLIIHQYGNYVIQVIVENWDDDELEDIINLYKNKYLYLSKQKYSSNVIERIIEKNEKNLNFYIDEICNDNKLSEVMQNNYGNYVIQKAVKLSNNQYKERLIKEIMKNIYKLEDKKIINKWKMIISLPKPY